MFDVGVFAYLDVRRSSFIRLRLEGNLFDPS